jgi:hypothetical protein
MPLAIITAGVVMLDSDSLDLIIISLGEQTSLLEKSLVGPIAQSL